MGSSRVALGWEGMRRYQNSRVSERVLWLRKSALKSHAHTEHTKWNQVYLPDSGAVPGCTDPNSVSEPMSQSLARLEHRTWYHPTQGHCCLDLSQIPLQFPTLRISRAPLLTLACLQHSRVTHVGRSYWSSSFFSVKPFFFSHKSFIFFPIYLGNVYQISSHLVWRESCQICNPTMPSPSLSLNYFL